MKRGGFFLLAFAVMIVACLGWGLFADDSTIEACIECGRISSERCSCAKNLEYRSIVNHYNLLTHEVTFSVLPNEEYKVDVPYSARPGIVAFIIDLPSFVMMPKCEVARPGWIFDKWQQVGATSNAMFSVGEKVTISSNTTFIATWKQNTSK